MHVKRVSFPRLSEESGVQCGVWETSIEQRVGDDGQAFEFKNF